MTDRTCGTCAWWDGKDKVKLVDGVWTQTAANGDKFPYIGPGRCMRDPVAVAKWPNDWCRHHATTRGWGEDMESIISQAEQESAPELIRENARLKARCQEARWLIVNKRGEINTEYAERKRLWLEGADDASS